MILRELGGRFKAVMLRCDCGRWNLEVRRVERKWDDVEVVATEIQDSGAGLFPD